jgi:hypothetical protein
MKNSPLNELTAQDIARKKIKLGNIEEKLSDTNISPRKERRLKEKQHKTKYQIETGQRGRPTSLRNEEWLAGTSRKSALNMLGVNKKEKPVEKKPELTEKEKKRLHAVASINYDKVVSSGGVDLGTIRRKK